MTQIGFTGVFAYSLPSSLNSPALSTETVGILVFYALAMYKMSFSILASLVFLDLNPTKMRNGGYHALCKVVMNNK